MRHEIALRDIQPLTAAEEINIVPPPVFAIWLPPVSPNRVYAQSSPESLDLRSQNHGRLRTSNSGITIAHNTLQ